MVVDRIGAWCLQSPGIRPSSGIHLVAGRSVGSIAVVVVLWYGGAAAGAGVVGLCGSVVDGTWPCSEAAGPLGPSFGLQPSEWNGRVGLQYGGEGCCVDPVL